MQLASAKRTMGRWKNRSLVYAATSKPRYKATLVEQSIAILRWPVNCCKTPSTQMWLAIRNGSRANAKTCRRMRKIAYAARTSRDVPRTKCCDVASADKLLRNLMAEMRYSRRNRRTRMWNASREREEKSSLVHATRVNHDMESNTCRIMRGNVTLADKCCCATVGWRNAIRVKADRQMNERTRICAHMRENVHKKKTQIVASALGINTMSHARGRLSLHEEFDPHLSRDSTFAARRPNPNDGWKRRSKYTLKVLIVYKQLGH